MSATPESERPIITEEILVVPEQERPIAGLGLFIINASTGRIWMVQEQTDKPSTARYAGQWTIPLETMKEGESPWEAVEGAMAEAFDDIDQEGRDIRETLFPALFHMRGNSLHDGPSIDFGGRSFDLNYAVLIYDGPDTNVQPYNSEEVKDGQWRHPLDLLRADVRKFTKLLAREALPDAYVENLIRFHQTPEDRLPAFKPGFSIRETYAARELHPDMR